MKEQITLQQISKFSENYNKDSSNKIIESEITKKGLELSCLNQEVIKENEPIFNIELPESKRYNQKDSHRCWIYAGINMIKHNVAQNLNIDIMNFELSNNYIAFFDKLEKSNNVYEHVISLKDTRLDYIRKERFVNSGVLEGGYWQYFVAIVNKYGIVPEIVMPNARESENYEKIERIFVEKVKKDVLYLLKLKKQKKMNEELRTVKDTFLQENYNILSKILGEPKFNFNYEYEDKNHQIKSYKNMNPIDFRNQFLTLNLKDFVSIGNLPMYNKEFYKIYAKKYLGNVHQNSEVTFLNLPIEDLKSLVIKQLKDKIPVWMGIYHKKFRDKESGVLDIRLYDYKDKLGFRPLTKKEALDTNDIWLDHAMTCCGVHLVDNKPIRWKIEDTRGAQVKVNGYYIMNDNYFNEFVLNVIINKKYLSKKQLELLDQKPIKFDIQDSF